MQKENEHFSETLEEIVEAGFRRFQGENKAKAHSKASNQVDFEEAYSQIKTSRARTPFAWITVNPKPSTSFEDLKEVCDEAFSKYFAWYAYAFEIRKAPDGGMHCHCLGQIYENRQNKNFSCIKDHFRNMIGNLKHVDIRYVSSDEIEKVWSYLNKTYQAGSKKPAYKATLDWREDNGIESIYIEGDLPTCLVPDPSNLISLN